MAMKLKHESENEVPSADTQAEQQRLHESVQTELMDKLDYIGMLYQEQYAGIDKRLEKCKSDMWGAIALFLVIAVIDGILGIMISSPGGSILALATEIWMAAIVLLIALVKTARDMWVAVFSYCVQVEMPFTARYIRKYNIFTLKEEGRYCSRKTEEVALLKKKLQSMEPGMPYTEYMEYEYVEKRADTDVLDWFYNHRVLVIVIAVGILVVGILF